MDNWDKKWEFRIGHDCVVTLHDEDTNDDMTIITDFHIVHINTNTWVWVRIVLFLLVCQHIVTSRTLTVVHVLCLSSISSTCAHEVSDSLRFCSLLLPHAPPVAFLPLLPALEGRRVPAAHSEQREYGFVWRVLPPHKLWAQLLRLPWIILRANAFEKCGFGLSTEFILTSLKTKLRDLPEDQNHKGPVQKTQ